VTTVHQRRIGRIGYQLPGWTRSGDAPGHPTRPRLDWTPGYGVGRRLLEWARDAHPCRVASIGFISHDPAATTSRSGGSDTRGPNAFRPDGPETSGQPGYRGSATAKETKDAHDPRQAHPSRDHGRPGGRRAWVCPADLGGNYPHDMAPSPAAVPVYLNLSDRVAGARRGGQSDSARTRRAHVTAGPSKRYADCDRSDPAMAFYEATLPDGLARSSPTATLGRTPTCWPRSAGSRLKAEAQSGAPLGQPSGTCFFGSRNGMSAERAAQIPPSGATMSSGVPGRASPIGSHT